jgi:tetratricopeptide (TPR) repeat protein
MKGCILVACCARLLSFGVIFILCHLVYLGPISAQQKDLAYAGNLLKAKKYNEAESTYRQLLRSDKLADSYAGLAESLAMQHKIRQALLVLKEARANNFANDANVLAVGGHVSYLHAHAVSYPYWGLHF